ncbi:MAG TPA: STAS domain-containing protein [Pseudomonadales bacterium]|jgi:anti-sigma B factor antagonist|nr:anti-anti-sigma factor [Gammaproteobacteria bacterium]MDP6025808.1 STAS domain-containing protein [Pseudomonadales bacterium]MDP6314923.1 STAS domain-containing protein [Pseudomonadales bacterium]MDP7314801.1 STAS domain-containing protein [Pseudomonadales bacterium]HJL60984.1 STAS domain-containing protein [Pseudomonadales bacterium]|tara:strand:+ start:662 stop:952 length:291 start_codon:yes stop_codon:yes gene_type:complete
MFEIELIEVGLVALRGRLDAVQANDAERFLDGIDSEFVIDLSELEYISSAGLGVLLKTHKRLIPFSGGLKLIRVTSHINDIFKYSGFDKLFEIETS